MPGTCLIASIALAERRPDMPSECGYFRQLAEQQHALRAHGFDYFPTEEELLAYLFDTNDKLELLATALGFSIEKDVLGRNFLTPCRKGNVR